MPGVRVTSLRPKKDRKQSVCSAFGLFLLRVTDSPVRDSIQTVCRYCCGCCHRMQRRNQRRHARAERCKLRNRNRKRLFLSAAVRASARSTPVVSAKEASSSIILFACVFSPILFSPKITLKLLKTAFVNFANGFPAKNTAARHSAAVFLLFLILHKSESRMRNIKYQHKQDKQHNACKTPKQSCNPGILFPHLVFVKGNHIFIEFFVRRAIC